MTQTASDAGLSNHAWLHGIVPPIITPLKDDDTLDAASLERQIARLLEAGVHGLFVLGSTGEVAYLDDTTRQRAVEATLGFVGGQVPVLVGLIETSPARVRSAYYRLVASREVAGVVCTAPYYGQAHPVEIERHFRSVAAAVPTRIVAYNIPTAVHASLDADLLVRLAQDDVIHGLKDSSGSDTLARSIVTEATLPPEFSVLTGSELAVDTALFAGVHGAVPGLANIDPFRYVRLYDHMISGEFDKAKHVQRDLISLFSLARSVDPQRMSAASAGVGGFKVAAHLLGAISSPKVPEPMVPLNAAETAAVRAQLVDSGLL